METARGQTKQACKPNNTAETNVGPVGAKGGRNSSVNNKPADEKAKKKSNSQSRQSKQNQQQPQQKHQHNSPNRQVNSNEKSRPSPQAPCTVQGPASKKPGGEASSSKENKAGDNICSNLQQFSDRAKELKDDINKALERQANLQIIEQPLEVVQLRDSILELSSSTDEPETTHADQNGTVTRDPEQPKPCERTDAVCSPATCKGESEVDQHGEKITITTIATNDQQTSQSSQLDDKLMAQDQQQSSNPKPPTPSPPSSPPDTTTKGVKNSHKSGKRIDGHPPKINQGLKEDTLSKETFEPLTAKLDAATKYAALSANLRQHFNGPPHLLEFICNKLIHLSDMNEQLKSECSKYKFENQKLILIKDKLENLSRELQKANNLIRIESLDLIKAEQSKAKEQTAKIQSTLSGVIKLFDENQQRNMNLRQENLELQSRLKTLLEHCDNWEKSVEAALKQRDIENRLIKTELAKSNLIKNEEREKFLGEKQELLHVLSMMQEQQHRIEGQEAKLRSDLSSYASKYDECQAVISKGMSKFQTESKRMLKQLETSRHDYRSLLSKYEGTTKRIAQLMEEKQHWNETMSVANKKIETLEKLCRALKADINTNDKKKKNSTTTTTTNVNSSKPSDKSQGGHQAKELQEPGNTNNNIENGNSIEAASKAS